MDEKAPETALVAIQPDLQVALRGAVSLWASATTSESERRADLLRDKQRVVLSFFRHTDKLTSEVEPADVQAWLRHLEGKDISAGTTYQHACLVSSFYSWAIKDPEVGRHVRRNPARLTRPKGETATDVLDAEVPERKLILGMGAIRELIAKAGAKLL